MQTSAENFSKLASKLMDDNFGGISSDIRDEIDNHAKQNAGLVWVFIFRFWFFLYLLRICGDINANKKCTQFRNYQLCKVRKTKKHRNGGTCR